MTSIIVNPATDPHSYEPTDAGRAHASPARSMAIVNGLGYDELGAEAAARQPARAGASC